MTPQEKAVELFDKYTDAVLKESNNGTWADLAKECALIAADEIMVYCYRGDIEFWQEVKQEIEKI